MDSEVTSKLKSIFDRLITLQEGLRGVGYTIADHELTSEEKERLGYAIVSMADNLQHLANDINILEVAA